MTPLWWQRVGLATFRVEQVCLKRLACASIAGFVSRDLTAAIKELFGLSPFNLVAETSQGLGLQVQKARFVVL